MAADKSDVRCDEQVMGIECRGAAYNSLCLNLYPECFFGLGMCSGLKFRLS